VSLSACLLSKIFQRQITKWDHADVLAENPTLAEVLSGRDIQVVRRVHGSSSTSLSTNYLKEACPSVPFGIQAGKGKAGADGNPIAAPFWDASTIKAEGSGGISSYLKNNAYAISYLDSGHGVKDGLREIALVNKNGTKLTSQEADVGGAAKQQEAGLPSEYTGSFDSVSLLNLPGER
jgi:ABC-type phosphate transport system substrate-binding protein